MVLFCDGGSSYPEAEVVVGEVSLEKVAHLFIKLILSRWGAYVKEKYSEAEKYSEVDGLEAERTPECEIESPQSFFLLLRRECFPDNEKAS